MEYRVEVTPSAFRESEEAYSYLSRSAPDAAVAWYNGLIDAIQSLATFPGRCSLAPESKALNREVFQLLYGKRGGIYRILFVFVGTDTVRVIHVRHGRRNALKPVDFYDW